MKHYTSSVHLFVVIPFYFSTFPFALMKEANENNQGRVDMPTSVILLTRTIIAFGVSEVKPYKSNKYFQNEFLYGSIRAEE